MEKHKTVLSHNRRAALAAVLFASALAYATPRVARADEAGDAKQATTFYRQARYDEAAVIFARLSVDHPDNPTYLWNLGACYYYDKRPDQAISTLRQYLSQNPSASAEEKTTADRWISEMEALKHGVPAAATGPVASGAPGVSAQALPPPAPRAESGDSHGAALALGIVGGVAVVGGVVCTIVSQSKFSDTQKKYDPSAESSGKTFSVLSFVGYGVGAAGLITAAVLLLGNHGESSRALVTPMVTASSVGLDVRAVF